MLMMVFSVCLFFSGTSYASYDDLHGKKVTKLKKQYCLALTKYYHQKIIQENYAFHTYRLGGLGVRDLDPGK